jgi:hypothetical protein
VFDHALAFDLTGIKRYFEPLIPSNIRHCVSSVPYACLYVSLCLTVQHCYYYHSFMFTVEGLGRTGHQFNQIPCLGLKTHFYLALSFLPFGPCNIGYYDYNSSEMNKSEIIDSVKIMDTLVDFNYSGQDRRKNGLDTFQILIVIKALTEKILSEEIELGPHRKIVRKEIQTQPVTEKIEPHSPSENS